MLTAYPHYKDSGLPWINRIPAHWETRRLTTFGKVGNGSTPSRDNAAYWAETGVPWLNSGTVHQGIIQKAPRYVTPIAVAECHLPLVPKGSIVIAITGQGKTRGSAAVLGIDATINQHLAYIAVRDHVANSLFLRFSLTAAYGMLRAVSDDVGGTKGALTCAAVKRFSVALPPRPEQDQIAHYLRTQDAKIARFIRIKRELIQRLNEQKLRLIDHAVTGGLDTTSQRKPSGVAWLGNMPEHWEVALLKHIAEVRFSGIDKHTHADETPVRLCNYTDVYKNDCITSDMPLMQATATPAEIARLTLQAGDVIITKDSETADDIGVPAWVQQDMPGVVCAYHLGLLRPQLQRILGEFLFFAIGSLRIAQQFHVLANGVTRFALGKHDVKNAIIPLPPIAEQHTILAHIKTQTAPIDRAIAQSEQEITLIREYRERLIADAVTGQIDVRGWQPSAEDMAFDDDSLAALADDDAPDAQEDARDEDE